MKKEKIKDSDKKDDLYFLMEYEGYSILKQIKLPVIESQLVTNKKEAIAAANNIGYPIVLKGMSRNITHKTEADIVKLPIYSERELKDAFEKILKNISEYDAEATVSGVLVQKLADEGVELIFGVKRDPVFGHQLVLGMGGTMVEIINDFTMRMMPVTKSEVLDMLEELKTYPILRGYRGQVGINIDEVINISLGLNQMIKERPEIAEIDLNPVVFSRGRAKICDVRILIDENKKKPNIQRSLTPVDKMINPTSIAVIGASANEKKNGGRLFRYITENKFPGNLYPVNPKSSEIRGYKTYQNLKDIPTKVDLACIIVAAHLVPSVMRDCVQKEVPSVIIYSSGFSEIGKKGEKLQEEVIKVAEEGNIRVLGPNSIGVASPKKKIYTAFGAALESKIKLSGNIGFISQSGAMGSALLSKAWEHRVGFSRWISVANEADLSATDFIEVLAEDELTKVISVFMEGLKDAQAFERASQKALENNKPLLIYKAGRSNIGKKAVQSHTGTIAGDNEVYSAAFEKFGALRIERLEDLIDASVALDTHPLPKGNNIGVMTASGGACSVIADLCADKGIELPELKNTSNEISKLIPTFGSAQNPIDVTAEVIAKPEMFKRVLRTLIADQKIDGVIVMLTTNADPGATIIAKAIFEVFTEQNKPIIVGRMGAGIIAPEAMELYEKNNFPVYTTPEKSVNIMHYLIKYNNIAKRKKQ